MVELVDTYALGAYAFRCAGSNPVPGTMFFRFCACKRIFCDRAKFKSDIMEA